MKKIVLVLLTVCFAGGIWAQDATRISVANLKKHVAYLASDKLKGRRTGERGEQKAAKYVQREFERVGLAPKGTDGYYHRFLFRYNPHNPHGEGRIDAPEREGTNVVGYLDNGAEYTIVVGAHLDHLGLGHDGNSLDPNPGGKIHNGADDNASGTAGVLELARIYSQNGIKERYNLLFICFSGEELGLYGSKRFCENPTIDLKKVHLMLNMDMIGRLDTTKALLVGGVGTSPDLDEIAQACATTFRVKLDSAGVGPSDHTSFYLKDIPVLFLFTGQHSDYHKPSDDANLVNYDGEREVLEYAMRVLAAADKAPKFAFTATKSKDAGGNTGFKVTLGIMPDYVFDGVGLRVDGVTEGKPASKAGLKAGDIIVGMGAFEVKGMEDYMGCLQKFNKGDTTIVRFRRDGADQEAKVTF